jgi:hypothetical protein
MGRCQEFRQIARSLPSPGNPRSGEEDIRLFKRVRPPEDALNSSVSGRKKARIQGFREERWRPYPWSPPSQRTITRDIRHLSSEAMWKELENNAETRPPGRGPEGPKSIGIIES